ncbi:MAG TPA: lamin tail domain-containing protein, partial [Candidatus Binatia bacterium]|nr:lamin tail domain-containing protein [Candidatus Binatia bacterium]
NAISVGQELIIPIGGLPTQTPQPTAVPTETPTVTPTPTSAVEEASPLIEITEVIGIGDLTKEAVRISNGGARPLMLRGWRMEDEDGNVYTFVDVTLYGSGDAGAPSILIHTEAGQNGPSDLYWGQEAAVWESGETVTVRDASGALQASYEIQ